MRNILIVTYLLFSNLVFANDDLKILENKNFRSIMKQPKNYEVMYDILKQDIEQYEDQSGDFLPVGKLILDQFGSACSGTLISENQVLTARHCIDEATWFFAGHTFKLDNGMEASIEEITFFEKRPSPFFTENLEDGHFLVMQENAYNDSIIVTLDKPLGKEVGFYELYDGDISELIGKNMTMAGYPETEGKQKGKYISRDVCRIADFKYSVITTNCFPRGGISGGPLLYRTWHGTNYVVATLTSPIINNELKLYGSTWSTLDEVISESKETRDENLGAAVLRRFTTEKKEN